MNLLNKLGDIITVEKLKKKYEVRLFFSVMAFLQNL
jgi:hypothetical protein